MKKKQIRIRWFISFFLILLISMAPATLIYHFSLEAIENQGLETNRAQQKLLESTLESVLEDVDRVADNLTINSEFAFLRNISTQMTTEQRWRLYKFGISSSKYIFSDDSLWSVINMTERLYYEDAYLREFHAQVLACQPEGEFFKVLLDRSAFYPTSGGQPFDTGVLGGVRVMDVNVKEGEVWHTVDRPLPVGESVHGVIDWPRRFDHMQQHAGDHLIAGALHRLMGGVTIGLHVGEDVSTIDVAMPDGETRISEEAIRRIEMDVNDHIQRNVPIRCWFPSAAELASLPLRKKPTVNEHVRIVAMGEDEMVACGGTHPSSAGQIGLVKILSVTPARGKMRVAFLAGRRALKDYIQCAQAAHNAAALLSSPVENLPASVAALQERLRTAEMEGIKLKKAQLLFRAQDFLDAAEVLPDGSKLIARFVDADASMLRELAAKLIQHPSVIALLGAPNGDQAIYVFGRSEDVQADMGSLLRNAALPLGGKGGGKPDFAQGGGSRDILEAARQSLRAEN